MFIVDICFFAKMKLDKFLHNVGEGKKLKDDKR